MTETPLPVSLATHRQAEFALVADLQRLSALAVGLGCTGLKDRIEEAHSRIADHHFSIAVVGEFKRGKSTLINALLGKEILPADILPTSATINRVTYDLEPFVEIMFRDGADRVRVQIADLANYVTKLTPQAKTTAATIAEAIVHYPIPFCKQNVDIIDTPGLSDEVAMTEITLGILPRVDAAILVTLATAPFSQSEGAFLEKLLIEYRLQSVLFVVTGIDKIGSPVDRERVLNGVSKRIEESVGRHAAKYFGDGTDAFQDYLRRVGSPRVFAVSGYDALVGKTERDHQLLEESRFLDFERFLEQFLAEESGLVALKAHTERLAALSAALLAEVKSRLASFEPAPPASLHENLEALIRSLEWLALDEKNRLDTGRRETESVVQQRLQQVPEMLRQAAKKAIGAINVTVEDLADQRATALVRNSALKTLETLNAAAAFKAQEFVSDLRARLAAPSASLLKLCVVFDRVMLHFNSSLVSPPETLDPGSRERFMAQRLGGGNGFDKAASNGAALNLLFDSFSHERLSAIAALLGMPPHWEGASLAIRPAKAADGFGKTVKDLWNASVFETEIQTKLTEAVARQLQKDSKDREEALKQQVAESFAVLGRHIEVILEEIRKQVSRLQDDRLRRAALLQNERQGLQRTQSEIQSIHERSLEAAKQLTTIQYRVTST